MPVAAVPVTLTASERRILKMRVRGAKTPYRDRVRAQVVLEAARGRENGQIAAGLGICVNTVRKWRGRFAAHGLGGLDDLPRSAGPGGSARLTGRPSSRWPASCPRSPGCRCRGGPAPS